MNVETLQNIVNQDIVIGVIATYNLHSVAQGTNMQLCHFCLRVIWIENSSELPLQPLAYMYIVLLVPSILEPINPVTSNANILQYLLNVSMKRRRFHCRHNILTLAK